MAFTAGFGKTAPAPGKDRRGMSGKLSAALEKLAGAVAALDAAVDARIEREGRLAVQKAGPLDMAAGFDIGDGWHLFMQDRP